ncbi:hypothetical protein CHUAL_009166 [Chamberlinius hualienensis]
MGGVILENLSGRKLAVLVSGLLLCQLACFLIGGCIAPAPYNTMSFLSIKCINKDINSRTTWSIARAKTFPTCQRVTDFNEITKMKNESITANNIVFTFQMPLPKEGIDLEYSRWFQNFIGVLQFDIEYNKKDSIDGKPSLTLDARLGYRNKDDHEGDWNLLADSVEERELDCSIDENEAKEGQYYSCQTIPLFELGSVHHDYYLLNLRLPIKKNSTMNSGIGKVKDVWLIVINQNGGFTMVWMSMKAFFFPCIIAIMIWYWRRIQMLERAPALLERMLFALGIALSLLNIPIEFLTLAIDMPFMLLLSDIRQGIFYATLLSFWLVFAGEHMMDEVDRSNIQAYWKHLSAVVFGCLCLFVFDMCERGVQLRNPFYSIWVTDVGTRLALTFIICAGISACFYFLFLCYMIFKVFRTIKFKRITISNMSNARRLFYEGIIYRFKFLMLATLLCAALTVISFIIGQVAEGKWKWDDDSHLEYTSAVVCGVYGMWNIYVFSLIVLYAPSHKHWPEENVPLSPRTEEIECSHLLTESTCEGSAIATLARKAATD